MPKSPDNKSYNKEELQVKNLTLKILEVNNSMKKLKVEDPNLTEKSQTVRNPTEKKVGRLKICSTNLWLNLWEQ